MAYQNAPENPSQSVLHIAAQTPFVQHRSTILSAYKHLRADPGPLVALGFLCLVWLSVSAVSPLVRERSRVQSSLAAPAYPIEIIEVIDTQRFLSILTLQMP